MDEVKCGKPMRGGNSCAKAVGHAWRCSTEAALASQAERVTLRDNKRRERGMWLELLKSARGCADCPPELKYYWSPMSLDFDHLPGAEKIGDIARLVMPKDPQRLFAELEKCEVVCCNHHRLRSATRGQFGRKLVKDVN